MLHKTIKEVLSALWSKQNTCYPVALLILRPTSCHTYIFFTLRS